MKRIIKTVTISMALAGFWGIGIAQAELVADSTQPIAASPKQNTAGTNKSQESNKKTENTTESKAQSSFIQQIRGKDDEYLWYTLFCGFVSILVKAIEYLIDESSNTTPGQVLKNNNMSLIGWFFSAAIVGYLGVVTSFLSVSAQTAVMVGIAWPYVYKQIKDKFGTQPPKSSSP